MKCHGINPLALILYRNGLVIMKKRLICLILIVSLSLCLAIPALGAASLSNFEANRTYRNQFSDISAGTWYYEGIAGVYEYGIMDGKNGGRFDPSGNLTIAETIKLASCLHKCYYTGSMDFETGAQWYTPYVDYALENGIIAEAYKNYNAPATRSDFAVIISGALPDEAVTPINRVDNGAIPDVYEHYSYGLAVYKLYRAGVLTGSDSAGTFYPGRTLSRAEAATIIMRLLKADTRQTVSLANPLTAEEIYKLASPAVFYVEAFDSEGEILKSGSGFFISSSGLAVTNYHVLVGAVTAKITMDNGDVRDIAGVYDYTWKNDLALIKINVSSVPFLEFGDSSEVQTGATVYTLGSPLGLQASFSRGIVSQALREIEGAEYIQLDAPISSGSSGGALIDTTGKVIGVTCATAVGAQNINLAVPINFISNLTHTSSVPLASILIKTPYYIEAYPAPDFGAYFNVSPFSTSSVLGGTAYSYLLSDLPGDPDDAIDTYSHIVEQNLFVHTSFITNEGVEYKVYYNSEHDIMIAIGKDVVKNKDCFTVIVS